MFSKAIIITARTSSTRLPKKILKKITKKDRVIDIIIKRSLETNFPIILATSNHSSDDKLVKYVTKKYKINIFRGSKNNKIRRWFNCMKKFKLEYAGFVDGDDLAFDFNLYSKVLRKINVNRSFLYKFDKRVIPGVFTYIISFKELHKIFLKTKKYKKIDVIEKFIDKKIINYKTLIFKKPLINEQIRLTLDYKDDLKFFRYLFRRISFKNSTIKIIKHIKQKKLARINYYLEDKWRNNQINEIKKNK